MSMVVAHNIPGINTQRQFNSSASGMASSMEKLSSGYKVNTGKDGAAALSISEKLRSQTNGLARAQKNTEEGMNVMGIAEGALNEMNSILKNLKALAIHSANTGVTSAEQVAADQAEADSAIQTIDRIASTTSFSNDKLLNGAKDIDFEQKTNIKGTQNNALLNERESSFSQIFKRDNYAVSINFTGTTSPDKDSAIGKADFSKQAMRAYLEIDTAEGVDQQGDFKDGKLTRDQSFTLVGNQGSRSFNFSQGDSVTDVVKAIKSSSASTGINAALTFNSKQTIDALSGAAADLSAARTKGEVTVSNNVQRNDDGTVKNAIITKVDMGSGVQAGKNTDGQGNVYVKFTSDTTYELYKDADMTKESMVATGLVGGKSKAVNNSGLDGVTITVSGAAKGLQGVRGLTISTAGIELESGANAGVKLNGSVVNNSGAMLSSEGSVVTGVALGTNTADDGKIYLKSVMNSGGQLQVFAYKNEKMREEDMVAKSDMTSGKVAGGERIVLNEVRNRDNTAGTGLSITMKVDTNIADFQSSGGSIATGNIEFTNLAARVYSEDYGSQGMIKLTQDKGAIFNTYDKANDASTKKLIEAGSNGTTFQTNGQDATLSVNGMQVKTNGLELKMATQDIQADFTFNQGKVGSTTLAQVGYGDGSLFTKIGALTVDSTDVSDKVTGISGLMCNAGHVTNTEIGDFKGGMQLQLGEGAGDQNRTVTGIKSMAINELGKVTEEGYWEGNAVKSKKTFSLQDVMGGGAASFSQSPTMAMKVIEKAITDVTETRAKIGAMQSNLLQTNSNNLAVTIENVTKTESGIRDTDMAAEMAEFTKNQVLQNAAMSMMSQANQQSQSALQLLR